MTRTVRAACVDSLPMAWDKTVATRTACGPAPGAPTATATRRRTSGVDGGRLGRSSTTPMPGPTTPMPWHGGSIQHTPRRAASLVTPPATRPAEAAHDTAPPRWRPSAACTCHSRCGGWRERRHAASTRLPLHTTRARTPALSADPPDHAHGLSLCLPCAQAC